LKAPIRGVLREMSEFEIMLLDRIITLEESLREAYSALLLKDFGAVLEDGTKVIDRVVESHSDDSLEEFKKIVP